MEVGHAHRPVVVGVDGSASAYQAVKWAAEEAARRQVELRLVRAFSWTTSERQTRHSGQVAQYRDQLLDVARHQVARASRIAAKTRPDVETTTQVEIGAPIEVLGSEARRAQLLVLGDRGLGGLAGLVLGSVAITLAARGACPIVIVLGERVGTGNQDGPVVVGIDGSPTSEAALAFAFDAAAARGVALVAVHAWSPTAIDDALAPVMDWDAVAVEEDAVLAERLAGWGQKYPQVTVRRTVVRDGAAQAIVDASNGAQLVVVGSRGRGNATGLLLGSISHGVLHAAHCPVAVVRSGTDF
jgi:nucleotide-binding universal stress UspA family protein